VAVAKPNKASPYFDNAIVEKNSPLKKITFLIYLGVRWIKDTKGTRVDTSHASTNFWISSVRVELAIPNSWGDLCPFYPLITNGWEADLAYSEFDPADWPRRWPWGQCDPGDPDNNVTKLQVAYT